MAIEEELTALKHFCNELSNWLSEDYPLFAFDQHLGASIAGRDFRVSVRQKHSEVNAFNDMRLIRQFHELRIRNELEIQLSFRRFGLLALTASPIYHMDGGGWAGTGALKTYYMYIPARLYTRYPRLGDKPRLPAG